MMTKSIIKTSWEEDMGQFLYHLDPRKITRSLEKLKLKIINKLCFIVFNKTCLNDILLIYPQNNDNNNCRKLNKTEP